MADLGTLPGATSILGNTPGASSGPRRRGSWAPRRSGAGTTQGPPPGGAQPQTFAQMQSAGLARPAPPPPGGAAPQAMQYQGSAQAAGPSRMMASQYGAPDVGGQYQQAVSNALSAPSRYDLPQVQQVRDALTSQLQQQFSGDARKLDEQMAQRGLSASSIGAGYQGDLRAAQSTALANLNAQLIQGQAATSAGDLAASLGAGQAYQALGQQGGQFQQSLAQQQRENEQQFGLAQGQLTGQYGGQSTLGGAQQRLAEQLGLGNLGVAQGQLGLGQQQLAQQGSQFGQQFGLSQLENQQQYGLSQAQQDLARQLGLGNLDVSRGQLAQQGQQFGQSLAEQQAQRQQQAGQFGQQFGQQQLENQQQYGLAQQQQDLARQLGLGNLGVAQGQLGVSQGELAQKGQQWNQDLLQRQLENQQQFGLAQSGLTGYYNGAQTLAGRTQEQQNALGAAGLTGYYNGQQTLGYNQQQMDWGAKNADRLEQARIANMGDATQRAGIQAQQDANKNEINQWLANWLLQQKRP